MSPFLPPHTPLYLLQTRKTLGIPGGSDPATKVILVMGGGEGVGALPSIVDSLYNRLISSGCRATVCVVCGRNEVLKRELNKREWILEPQPRRLKKRARLKRKLKRGAAYFKGSSLSGPLIQSPPGATTNSLTLGGADYPPSVHVVGLGFIRNMDEWMAASDVLVTKAGPGTIAEAAAVGLPVMLTSYLPGQEAGNVDVVLKNGFGMYETKPGKIAEKVVGWLEGDGILEKMSR